MSRILYQVIGALVLDYNVLIYGLTAGIPPATLVHFMSENTTLNRPMTPTEGSLLVSLASIGALTGTPLVGFLMDFLGRKKSTLVPVIINMLSWTLLAFGNKVEMILTAVFALGVGASIFLVVPVYISEMAEDSIRGTLATGPLVCNGFGMLLTFILGEFLNYKTIAYIGLTASVIGVASVSILKESPTLLMKKGLEEEAVKAMGFYRNSDPNSKIVIQDIEKIRRALAPEPEEVAPEKQKLTAEFSIAPTEKLSRSKWQFIKKSRSTQRAIALVLILTTASIWEGMMVIQMYSLSLFTEAVPREILSPNWCCAVLSTVGVISGLIASYLTDVSGRRPLFIYGTFISGICCLILGTQFHLQWGPKWITVIFIYIFQSSITFSSGTVPFLLMAEIFLPEVRNIMSMICLEWDWLCNFTTVFLFSPLVAALGLGPVFYFFSSVCFCTAVFAYFFQPETKGLSVDAIQLLLMGK